MAYQELSAARRRILHRRVAEALEAEHAMNLEAVSGQIARHHERAVTYYMQAADVAQRVSATTEAIDYLRRARALLPSYATPSVKEHRSTLVTLHQRLGDLFHLTEQYGEARNAEGLRRRYILLKNLSGGVSVFDKSLEVGAFRSRAEQRAIYGAGNVKILVNATTVKLDFQDLARTVVPNRTKIA